MRRHTTRTPKRDLLRADDGASLMELVVSTALATVVLLGILGAFDVFRTTVDATAKASTSQEIARASLRDMVIGLRQGRVPAGEVTPIDHTATASSTDLVVARWFPTDQPKPTAGFTRYCVSADGKSLLSATRYASTWAAAGSPGPCQTTSTTDPATGWAYTLVIPKIVSGTAPLFSYTSDTCFGTTGTSCPPPATAVRAVSVRLQLVDRSSSGAGRRIDQSASVSLRNRF